MEEAINKLQNSVNSFECDIQRLEDRIKDSKSNLKSEEEELAFKIKALKQCREAINVLKAKVE